MSLKVLPWVVDGAGGLGAGKTSGAGTRGVDLNAAVGGRTGYTDTNGGESSNNGSKIHADCYPAKNPSLSRKLMRIILSTSECPYLSEKIYINPIVKKYLADLASGAHQRQLAIPGK